MLLLVDSNSLLHRAYHALPLSLVTSDGTPVNAIYGFTSMLLDAILKLKPKYVACAFDSRAPTFRHREFAEYKAHRPKTDSTLIKQIDLAKQVVEALSIPMFVLEGFEADDIIATIVTQLQKRGELPGKIKKALILTSDKDLFALVNKYVHVVMPQGNFKNLKEFGPKEVFQKMGVLPSQIYDYKALVGDPSDNIPGVKGVGAKTAVALLSEYKTLENIYKNLDTIKERKKSLYEKLSSGYEDAMLSYKIVQIKRDVPIVFNLSEASLKGFDFALAYNLFLKLEFKSLVKRLKDMYKMITGQEPVMSEKAPTQILTTKISTKIEHFLLDDLKKTPTLLENIFANKNTIYLYTNNTLFYTYTKDESIATAISQLFRQTYKLMGKHNNPNIELDNAPQCSMAIGYGWSQLIQDFFKHDQISGATPHANKGYPNQQNVTNSQQQTLLIEHPAASKQNQAKFRSSFKIPDISTLVSLPPIWDIQLVAYTLSTGRQDYSFEQLALMYLGTSLSINTNNTTESATPSTSFRSQPHNQSPLQILLGAIISIFLKQQEILEKIRKKHKKLSALLATVIDPVVAIGVHHMSYNGITLNLNKVQEYYVWLSKQLKELEQQIYQTVGFEFNINSTKQLSHVLYNVLNLPVTKRKKTVYSTDSQSLQQIYDTHPVIPLLLEHRKLQKILSTYVKPFLQLRKDNASASYLRIHSTFDALKTSTGRLASSNPNLQNLPIRTEEGAKIRTFFEPAPGHVFIKFDYSQIDLRVLAHTSQDEHLIESFKQGLDIHKQTAAKIFNVDYESVTSEQRRVAKTINFGIVYGMSAHGLAQTLQIPHTQAKEFINRYFEEFPGVIKYIETIEEFVKKHGFVLSLLGRRRFIYGIDSNNYNSRQAALREAINMPIQGGSDDIIRTAIMQIYKKDTHIQSNTVKLVLQIHDELVFETPNQKEYTDIDAPSSWAYKIKNIMETTIGLRVPIKVGVEISKNI